MDILEREVFKVSIRDAFRKIRKRWHFDLAYQMDYRTSAYFNSIFSFCQNEAVLRQLNSMGGGKIDSLLYQYHRKLHRLCCVMEVDSSKGQLVRIGNRKTDGGYFTYQNEAGEFSTKKTAYSFGIANDVTWDLAMAEFGYDIYMYDHTIDGLPIENDKFHWKKIGITGRNETKNLKSLETVLMMNGHQNDSGMFLKCDIEGAEWEMLDAADADVLSRFDQITIELHYLMSASHRETILRCLYKLSKTHQVIHLHANNNGHVEFCGNLITPDLLEVTFLKRDLYKWRECSYFYPREIDVPNNNDKIDIMLGKWNI